MKEWAAREGAGYSTARQWYADGLLPVPARKVGGLILIGDGEGRAAAGAGYVEAALGAQGRRLLVVDPAEADDDLVRDVTEILTSLYARLYGRRAAANRAARGMAAITGDQQ